MIPRCPVCNSNETQHVGWDLKCLACGAMTVETAHPVTDHQVPTPMSAVGDRTVDPGAQHTGGPHES